MLNKKAVIVASSLAAIPLTAVLIAIVNRRAMHRSLQRTKLLKQTRSESNTLTNIAITNSQQQNEASQSQSESLRQSLETVEATTNNTATATTSISATANVLNSDKDIVVPVTLSVLVSSPTDPSSSNVSPIVASPSQTPKEQEISFNDEARKAGESLKEWIAAAIKDAKDSAKGTGKRLKEETIGNADPTDSKNIQSLEDTLNTLVGLFEKTMIEIRKESYDEQVNLLQSYKDLLQTQIKVVKARGTMARKLKPGA